MGCLTMKNEEWWVPGYGTEKVGPFLESLVGMTRPQRILEIGMGYTTPFLLNGLKENTEGLLWDLVWVDCGGWEEYKFFAENYWHMVKEYVLFHFTYFKGEPNKNLEVVSQLPAAFRMDIIEPHKFRQGSITMLRKV